MKISIYGLEIQPGKYKYSSDHFAKLVKKFEPKKVTPFTVEFVMEDFDKTDAVVFPADKKFDFIFIDLEKVEKRLNKAVEEKEVELLKKVQALLEKEQLLCDQEFTPEEKEILREQAFVTYKPSLAVSGTEDMDSLIKAVCDKAGVLLFYTAGKKEVHAWDIKKGDSAVVAAGRIHSDLARGFIKADIVNCSRLDDFFNMAEAKARGFVKSVGKKHLMEEGDILEVKFSV